MESQTRRMQLSGGSTYVVSLPKAWVEDMGVGAGGNVTITRNPDCSLTLSPGGRAPGPRGTAVISAGARDSEDGLRRRMISAYLAGYCTIRVRGAGGGISAGHARAIRGLVRSSMMGTEITESGPGSVTVRVLAGLSELPFATALERMRLVAAGMVAGAVEAAGAADAAHADSVVSMDDEVDRFGLYMRRSLVAAVGDAGVLREAGLRTAADCLGYRTVVGRIERIADHAVLIAKRTRFLTGAMEPGTLAAMRGLSESALGAFEAAVCAVQGRDFAAGERAAGLAAAAVAEEKRIMGGIREDEGGATVARFVLEDLRRVAEYSTDIAEVAIDGNVGGIVAEE